MKCRKEGRGKNVRKVKRNAKDSKRVHWIS